MTAPSMLDSAPLIPNWEAHEFSDFVWPRRHHDSLRFAVCEWGLAYAYALAPDMGEDKAQRLTDELDNSGWREAAERGKSLKSGFVEGAGAQLLAGYYPCCIAAQLNCPTIDAALEIAWAMRRARGYTSAQLLADLKGHIKDGA